MLIEADTPIDTLIWNTAEVTYISDGVRIDKPSNTVAVKVVPEPATIALFGIGLLGVFALGQRKQRQKK